MTSICNPMVVTHYIFLQKTDEEETSGWFIIQIERLISEESIRPRRAVRLS